MESLKKFIAKVTATWAAIGAALITLAATGFINIPDVIESLFSPAIGEALNIALTAIVVAIGAAIEFYQLVRVIFAPKPVTEGQVKTLSVAAKREFALNPFKLLAA